MLWRLVYLQLMSLPLMICTHHHDLNQKDGCNDRVPYGLRSNIQPI